MSVQTLDVRRQEYSHGKILEDHHEGCEELQSASPKALALGLSCPFWNRKFQYVVFKFKVIGFNYNGSF